MFSMFYVKGKYIQDPGYAYATFHFLFPASPFVFGNGKKSVDYGERESKVQTTRLASKKRKKRRRRKRGDGEKTCPLSNRGISYHAMPCHAHATSVLP